MIKFTVVSSSLARSSRSRELAKICVNTLKENSDVSVDWIDLREVNAPNFDDDTIFDSDAYKHCHQTVLESDGLLLASPVYNWGCCAELKKFMEYVGSTPPDGSLKGAFFDKVVTVVNSAGLPHSYMASQSLISSLLLDFKCIINPYNIYVHNRHWEEKGLIDEAKNRVEKSMTVFIELVTLLANRTYKSEWEI